MSVIGVGIDIVSVTRIADLLERHGDRFLERCFRPSEITESSNPTGRIAARWAAKEALLKALGADVRNIPYRDVEVVKCLEGPVSLVLHGRARQALEKVGGRKIHLSISHERDSAVASVLIEG